MEKYARILFFIKNFSTFERSGKRVVRVAYCVFSGAIAAIKILMARNSQRKSSLVIAVRRFKKKQNLRKEGRKASIVTLVAVQIFRQKNYVGVWRAWKVIFHFTDLETRDFFPLYISLDPFVQCWNLFCPCCNAIAIKCFAFLLASAIQFYFPRLCDTERILNQG